MRIGAVEPGGEEGSAAKWAHAAIAIAARTLLDRWPPTPNRPPPAAVLGLLERVVGEGRERTGAEGDGGGDFTPDDARSLLSAWIEAVGLDGGPALIELMQADGFSHRDLYRRARSVHDARLRAVSDAATEEIAEHGSAVQTTAALFQACVPVIPYAPAIAFLAGERSRLDRVDGRPAARRARRRRDRRPARRLAHDRADQGARRARLRRRGRRHRSASNTQPNQ